MSFRKKLIHRVARTLTHIQQRDYQRAPQCQSRIFRQFIAKGMATRFGREHDFAGIRHYSDFADRVPVRDYEDLKPWIDEIRKGAKDVLWPGQPRYFCKTSGTTSGAKYIPITLESMGNQIRSARTALFHYISRTPDTDVFGGKMFFLSGSPRLDQEGIIPVGRLSGIVNHEIPSWFQSNKLPDYALNCIEPWEAKIDALTDFVLGQDIRVISGIPPWVQMFCEQLLLKTGKDNLSQLFPRLELYVHGGVNYTPYGGRLRSLFGKDIALLETYPASEGFIAFQDDEGDPGLQLVVNDGIFYEFIPKSEVHLPNPKRLQLTGVSTGVDYAVVLTTNAGLWSYLIGDLVRFTSLNPYKIVVSGRISQFISAFGEHVIGSEIDQAIRYAQQAHQFDFVEFTVAPQVSPSDNKHPYHEWYIEFAEIPRNLHEIALTINSRLCELNSYYKDLIDGNLLDTLRIRPVRKNAFLNYMRRVGRLGEQFKVHRLSNDRHVADALANDILP
ncbi:MAG: GH3 auxin-responsive promoter family protein [Saprospiraceae bacterium]|nr:GH3 auxin-responsive promoter family protein [Saprospiraceae bacterium]